MLLGLKKYVNRFVGYLPTNQRNQFYISLKHSEYRESINIELFQPMKRSHDGQPFVIQEVAAPTKVIFEVSHSSLC